MSEKEGDKMFSAKNRTSLASLVLFLGGALVTLVVVRFVVFGVSVDSTLFDVIKLVARIFVNVLYAVVPLLVAASLALVVRVVDRIVAKDVRFSGVLHALLGVLLGASLGMLLVWAGASEWTRDIFSSLGGSIRWSSGVYAVVGVVAGVLSAVTYWASAIFFYKRLFRSRTAQTSLAEHAAQTSVWARQNQQREAKVVKQKSGTG